MSNNIEALFGDPTLRSLKLSLESSAVRHQALASNIANINTPNYKRVDLTPQFQSSMKEALQHLDRGQDALPLIPQQALGQDPTKLSERLDGNNVTLDQELLELTKNQTLFEFSSALAAKKYQGLKAAITGRNG